MSTQCIVAYKDKKDNIVASVVRHDGYITDGVGDSLKNNYTSPEDAKWVASLGNRDHLSIPPEKSVYKLISEKGLEDFEAHYSQKEDIAFIFIYINGIWYYKAPNMGEDGWLEL